jgi:hypothetical protein
MQPKAENKITIYGPKNDGTYWVEFKTDKGESLVISDQVRKRRAVRARVRALWGLSGWRGNERIADSIKKGRSASGRRLLFRKRSSA